MQGHLKSGQKKSLDYDTTKVSFMHPEELMTENAVLHRYILDYVDIFRLPQGGEAERERMQRRHCRHYIGCNLMRTLNLVHFQSRTYYRT